MRLGAALLALLPLAAAELPVVDVFRGNPRPKTNDPDCVSWWCPMLVSTNTNTTLLYGCCKTGLRGKVLLRATRSTDAGRSWAEPTTPQHVGQAVYSRRSGALFMTAGDAKGQLALQQHPDPPADSPDASPCAIALNKYCGAEAGKGAACLACEKRHPAKWAACDTSKLSRFCNATAPPVPPPKPHPRPPPTPPANPYKTAWAHELPPLTEAQLAKCESTLIKSTDDGRKSHAFSKSSRASKPNLSPRCRQTRFQRRHCSRSTTASARTTREAVSTTALRSSTARTPAAWPSRGGSTAPARWEITACLCTSDQLFSSLMIKGRAGPWASFCLRAGQSARSPRCPTGPC